MKTIELILFHFETIFKFGWKYLIVYLFIISISFLIIKKNNLMEKSSFIYRNYEIIILLIANVIINILPSFIYDIKSIFNYKEKYNLSIGIITSSLTIFIGPIYIIILKFIFQILKKIARNE